ncbi:hypothetical protein EDC04DRAFT_2562512 [Pisolithus marmoratus]|nr:hypothetical protein EDC04DRAFT_2562512 [Pisolithus marmoratus]
MSAYYQYVTLSHRWGESEPLLRDVEGRSIYDMSTTPGFRKLQFFCLRACQQDYLWAWSDTCCIDKDSSAELQEAIGSMFVWYRGSALTIVHLSDVPDTGPLDTSQWFERGWTLQELLAPQCVLFFNQSWSLYKDLAASNHKADVPVLVELEKATGIESRFLTNFCPGMEDARSRLRWASSRRTTRPEDIAYSLFGIFNLHLPVLYGESAENALGRLVAEIISQSGDISILDWVGEPSPFHSCFPAHITSYQHPLPSPPVRPCPEEQLSTVVRSPISFKIQRKLLKPFAAALQFLSRPLKRSSITHHVPAVRPALFAPSDVYEFHSFTEAPYHDLSIAVLYCHASPIR